MSGSSKNILSQIQPKKELKIQVFKTSLECAFYSIKMEKVFK